MIAYILNKEVITGGSCIIILYIGKQVIEACPGADKDDSINVSRTVFKGMTYQGLVNIQLSIT